MNEHAHFTMMTYETIDHTISSLFTNQQLVALVIISLKCPQLRPSKPKAN